MLFLLAKPQKIDECKRRKKLRRDKISLGNSREIKIE